MKLSDADILRLLPEHISGDSQFAAAGDAANKTLAAISKAIPNLLIWARLGQADSAQFLPPLRRLTEARPGLRDLDIEALESLAWQFHVDFLEVAHTRQELAGMVLNSIPWHRIKGTPASIRAALALFGYDNVTIEEHDFTMHWATYQLGLPSIMDLSDVARIVAICREMQPARCRLWRVYTGGGADNPDADPDDGFDRRPGVWSGPLPRCAWSNAWWSFYSGVQFPDIPGLDGGLVVSFGQKKSYASEPWQDKDAFAAVWHDNLRAFIIRRLTHYIWSYSRWSDLYPPRHGFVVGQLFSSQAADLIYESRPWPDAPWPDLSWGTGFYWDRILPQWRMWVRETYKSQGVYSDTSDKEKSAWSALNCNWSWPVLAFVPKAPRWSAARWSGDSQRVRYEIIREQFQRYLRLMADNLAPGFGSDAPCGAAVANGLAFHLWYNDGPVWGRTDYSDYFPARHGFVQRSLLATLAGRAIVRSGSWQERPWPDLPWGEVIGFGREEAPWAMRVFGTSGSQGVYSDASDKEKSAWSALNCNWSRPGFYVPGRAPAWGRDKYSDGCQRMRFEIVHEQRRETMSLGTPALVGHPARGGCAIHEKKAEGIAKIDGPFWSESDWSGEGEKLRRLSMQQKRGAIAGEALWQSGAWPDAPWPARAWAEIAGYGREQKNFAAKITSKEKA